MATVVSDVVDQVVTKSDGHYSGEDSAVQSACAAAHTSEAVTAYRNALAAMIAGD